MKKVELVECNIFSWECPYCSYGNEESTCAVENILQDEKMDKKTVQCSGCGKICEIKYIY